MSEVRALSHRLVSSAYRMMSRTSQRFVRGPKSQYGISKVLNVSVDTPSHVAASSRAKKRRGGMVEVWAKSVRMTVKGSPYSVTDMGIASDATRRRMPLKENVPLKDIRSIK